MKYNIQTNQYAIREAGLIDQVDLIDCALLDLIYHLTVTHKSKKIDEGDKRFVLIKLNYVNDQIPIAGIKSAPTLYRRVEKLVRLGLVDRHPNNKKLQGVYVSISCVGIEIWEAGPHSKMNDTSFKNERPRRSKMNDYNNISNNINNNNRDLDEIHSVFNELHRGLNGRARDLRLTNSRRSLINARIRDKHTPDEIISTLRFMFKKWKGTEFERHLNYETLMGTKFEKYFEWWDGVDTKESKSIDPRVSW